MVNRLVVSVERALSNFNLLHHRLWIWFLHLLPPDLPSPKRRRRPRALPRLAKQLLLLQRPLPPLPQRVACSEALRSTQSWTTSLRRAWVSLLAHLSIILYLTSSSDISD